MYSSTLPSLFLPASKNTAWWGLHLGEIIGNGLKKDLLLFKSLFCFGCMNECTSKAPWPSIKWKMKALQPQVLLQKKTEVWPLKGKLIFDFDLNTTSTVFKIFCVTDMLRIIVCWVAPIWSATVSNLKTRLSLAYSSTVAAARQQTQSRHPAGDSCKRTDQIVLASADVAALNMKSDRWNFSTNNVLPNVRDGVKGTWMYCWWHASELWRLCNKLVTVCL